MSYREKTRVVHGSNRKNEERALVMPVYRTSTFKFDTVEQGGRVFAEQEDAYLYGRISNPNTDELQDRLAILENSEAALVTSTGMSAINTMLFGLLKAGDHLVSCSAVYGGTFCLFNYIERFNISHTFISQKDCNDRKKIEEKITKDTKFLYIETPTNPNLDIIDIGLWANVAKKHNILLVVDNTFASPFITKPLDIGADIVIHSLTKYINGHGDIVGGAVLSNKKIIGAIKEYFHLSGPCLSPDSAWLVSRGSKTLHLRMKEHCENAQLIAEWLENFKNKNGKIDKIYYPGLSSHPGHAIAKRQMNGMYGGMISLELKGDITVGRKFLNDLKLPGIAVSLGDCESLIQHPASMTHSRYTLEDRTKAGITDGLIRLSVGIEDVNDIITDLYEALQKI